MDTRGRNPGMGGSATGGAATGGATGQGAAPVKEQVQQGAAQVKEQVQQGASALKDTVSEQATDQLATQKDAASGGLQSVAHAFRQTGEQLRDQDQDRIAGYVERAAEQFEQFSTYLGQRDIRELARDAEQFARREPALFLGGAFALGLFASRFLKSSAQGSTGSGASGSGARGVAGDWRGQADWYGQDRSRGGSSLQDVPALPSPTGGAFTPTMGTEAATGTGRAGAGLAGTGLSASGADEDVIVGGPPLPTDVIVGGPPREPGQGTRR